jgi:group I intron endonuclease
MNLNTAGIYRITNNINGKVYIGQSMNIKNRWRQHKYGAFEMNGHCRYLYSAMHKYGINNFSITVIEKLNRNTNLFIEDDLNKFEEYFIEKYHSFVDDPLCNGYNLTKGGDHVVMSLTTRQKISEKNTGKHHSKKTKNKLSLASKNYWNSPEALKQLKIRLNGNTYAKGKHRSKQQIEKWKNSMKPIYDKITLDHWELIKDYNKFEYGWIEKASQKTGLTHVQIREVCDKLNIPRLRIHHDRLEKEYSNVVSFVSDYDKSEKGWISKVAIKMNLPFWLVYKICVVAGFYMEINHDDQQKKFNNDWKLIEHLDKSKWGWISNAVKLTRLTRTRIVYLCKKMGIDWRTINNNRDNAYKLLEKYDFSKPGELSRAVRDTGLSLSRVIRFKNKMK